MTSLGPLIQLGLVVPDLDAAVEAWLSRGIGPFFEVHHVPLLTAHYGGAPTAIDMSVAIAYSGATQIEIIAAHGEAPSVYRDFLIARPEGGIHHVAFLANDYEAALSRARGEGRVVQEMTAATGGRFAYLTADPAIGGYVELIEAQKALLRLFEHIRSACASWDGSAPRRVLG